MSESKPVNTNEQTTVNDRIQQIINHYNLNKSSFSKAIGLTGSVTITNIVSGRKSKPSYDVLRKIAEAFPINLSWLILGKGPMLLNAGNELESYDIEVEDIVNTIMRSPERFEKHPMFAKYLENERNKAIVENQNELLIKYRKLGLD